MDLALLKTKGEGQVLLRGSRAEWIGFSEVKERHFCVIGRVVIDNFRGRGGRIHFINKVAGLRLSD